MSDLLYTLREEETAIPEKGKAYAHRKSFEDRPKGDFYATPRSLFWEVSDVVEREFDNRYPVLEPASGTNILVEELEKLQFPVHDNDLYFGGIDYTASLLLDSYKQVITNPPFSQWDAFVQKAKSHAEKIMMIGRLNYFGTNSRLQSGIWDHLKSVHIFNRYVDYQTPPRTDGLFHVGAMATGWFLWDMNYDGNPTIHFVDVQKYAQLGGFRK